MHIVDVVVQSAAPYSLALLVTAIATVVWVTFGDPSLPMFAVFVYVGTVILTSVSVRTFGVQILGKV